MKAILIAAVLAARSLWLDATNTAYDDCRAWAYNNNDVITSVPDDLWRRLEKQATREGYADATALLRAHGYTVEE